MTDTRELLKKISALRQRLDQAQGLASAAAVTLIETEPASEPLQQLQHKVQTGSWQASLLDTSIRPFPETKPFGETAVLPALLTARAVRLLKRAKELLDEMRVVAENASLRLDDMSALPVLHRQCVAMTDAVIRMVQAFPSAPSAQMKLCEGLEEIVALIDEKLSTLKSGLALSRTEQKRIELLADILTNLAAGNAISVSALVPLAQELVNDAKQMAALRFLHADADHPARFVAAHSLTVAQVVARVLQRDADWHNRLQEPLLVALVHDVGMIHVPAEILSQPGPLDDEQRRIVERHPIVGRELASRLWPGGGWPVEAVADHHERVDGTGYPGGRGEQQIGMFSRILAVCDVYAALACSRPYRAAFDSRTALTDTLLLADQGALDRYQAERLLGLSFYPVGSVVELSDGAVGVVVDFHAGPTGNLHPAKPVVSLLTDSHGLPVPIPRHVDLAQDDPRTVLRNLPPHDRRHLMLKRYPQLA